MKKLLFCMVVLLISASITAQVANSGFENWTTVTDYSNPAVYPANFTSVNQQLFYDSDSLGLFEVDGVSGSAMHLETIGFAGDTVAAYGVFGNPPQGDGLVFSGGFPFTDVTVSGITMDLRYNINPMSPGFVMVQFLAGGVPVTGGPNDDGTYIFPISGDQPNWTSTTFDLIPSLTQIPDECVFAFGSNDLLADSATFFPGDWLEVDNLEFEGTMMADIPGGDFDTWVDVTSTLLDDWDTYLPPFYDFITPSGDSYSGDFSARLESIEIDSADVVQAMIYQAELSENGILPNQPLVNNSNALQFYYKFSSPDISEEAIVYLLLSEVANPAPEDIFFITSPLAQTDNYVQSTIDFAEDYPNAAYYGLLFFSGGGFDVDGVDGSVLLLDDVSFLTATDDCTFEPTINEGDVTTCEGGDLELTTQQYDSYAWYGGVEGLGFNFIDDTPSLSAQDAEPGEYLVFVLATMDNCTASSDTVTVIVTPAPVPEISQDGNTLTTAAGMASYTWYYNGGIIGNTNTIAIQGNGNYAVFIETPEGCTGQSADYIVTDVGVEELDNRFVIYPNPVKDQLNIVVSNAQPVELKIHDLLGKLVMEEAIGQEKQTQIDVSYLSAGTYVLSLSDEEHVVTRKIVIE